MVGEGQAVGWGHLGKPVRIGSGMEGWGKLKVDNVEFYLSPVFLENSSLYSWKQLTQRTTFPRTT